MRTLHVWTRTGLWTVYQKVARPGRHVGVSQKDLKAIVRVVG
jgi:hypothetical protein